MQRRERAFGTNRDFAHGVDRPRRSSEPTDAQLLAGARRDARVWQQQLAQSRHAEQINTEIRARR